MTVRIRPPPRRYLPPGLPYAAGVGPTADTFSALAPLLRVRPQIQQFCRFGSPWVAEHGAERSGWAPFHIVTRGSCLLDAADQKGIRLGTGDVVLLPHGGTHVLYSLSGPSGSRAGSSAPQPSMAAHDPPLRLSRLSSGLVLKTNTGIDADAQVVCGRLRFEQVHDNMVLAVLPPVIVMRAAEQSGDSQRVQQLAAAMRQEIEADQPGAAAIAGDLASALLIMVLRAYLRHPRTARELPASAGVLALLEQRPTGKALAAMLAAPGRAWTLDELASAAGTSRATLVRAFQRVGGIAPLALLAQLRLNLARHRLASTREPIATIAATFGYQSESSFSRAYRRRFGVAPGHTRHARARPAP
jgi:AraC family transcriptional activator of mtrCDE